MRIGIDARLYGITCGTGIGRYTEELIRALGSLDTDNDYVIFLRKDGFDSFTPPNERWSSVLADFRPYSLAVQTKFPRVIRDAKIDLMHFTHFDHPLAYRGRFLTTIHDLILLHHPTTRASTLGPLKFWIKYLAYRVILCHAARSSRLVLTPSNAVRDAVMEHFHLTSDRVRATHLGIDHHKMLENGELMVDSGELIVEDITQLSTINSQLSTPYLLYVGNAYPHKNLEQLIRVARTLAHETPHVQVVIVGREDDFSHKLRNCNPPNVIFAGAVTNHALNVLYTNATAYVSMSREEGFDIPTVEALSHGTPVIASDIPVHREILGTAAQFVPIDDDAALVNAIHRTVLNRNICATMSTDCAQQYTWRECAQQTLSAYRTVYEFRHAHDESTHRGATT
ncbi:MAG: glycosyltransferase family 1 protein [Candidatus Uhrbacteria bacterium]